MGKLVPIRVSFPIFLLTNLMKMIIISIGCGFHYRLEGDQEDVEEKKKYSMDDNGGSYSCIHSRLRK
jgi:outer membrane lipopolysaccharide assembly protein LptE/RlpB